MRCPNCGLDNPAGMLYCTRCGLPLPKESEYKPIPTVRGMDEKGKGTRGGNGATRKRPPIPVAALIWLFVVALVMGKEAFLPERGYTSRAYAVQALQSPLQAAFDSNFKAAEMKGYTELVLGSIPAEAKSAGIDVDADLLKDCTDEIKQLVKYASDDGESSLYIDVMTDENGDLDSDSLAEIRDEMRKAGVDGSPDQGCRIKLGITIDAFEDTPLLKGGGKKFEDIEDIGVCAVRMNNRWYLWPSQTV